MSLSKRYFERQMEEGWCSVGGSVCAECFTDYAIREFIEANLTGCECSYCGKKTKKKPIAADMDEVLSFISQGFAREYDIPENTLPWDSSEGGWQLVTPDDAYDLITELGICSEGGGTLQDDLVSAFSNRQFVRSDPLGVSREDGFRYSWESFCDHTKHETRFVFFRERRTRRRKNEGPEEWEGQSIPYHILLELGWMVKSYGLIKPLPKGTWIFRARQHSSLDHPSTANDLGAPPKEKASQSRMSPAGIPMFYGANDEKTAFVEIFDSSQGQDDVVTFGSFQTTRRLRMLDLTDIPEVPSMFDEARHEERPTLIFLHHFQRDISKPIARDNRIHFEYVPTQIVAEYFRHIYRENRCRVDGIMFKSSLRGGDICYCVFASPDACTDGPKAKAVHRLLLRSHRPTQIDFTTGSFT